MTCVPVADVTSTHGGAGSEDLQFGRGPVWTGAGPESSNGTGEEKHVVETCAGAR